MDWKTMPFDRFQTIQGNGAIQNIDYDPVRSNHVQNIQHIGLHVSSGTSRTVGVYKSVAGDFRFVVELNSDSSPANGQMRQTIFLTEGQQLRLVLPAALIASETIDILISGWERNLVRDDYPPEVVAVVATAAG